MIADSAPMSMLKHDLTGYTGTMQYHRLSLAPIACTDGVRAFAEKTNAFWLVSDLTIASVMKYRNVAFQFWKIEVDVDKSAVLTMREDCDRPILHHQKYKWVDLPAGTLEFYLIHGVLMLPSDIMTW